MPGFEAWDVVRVPFPYTNRLVQQRRPALVVAHHAGKDVPSLLWVLMITSATHRRWPDDVEVSDLVAAGLPAPSIVRPTKIATIEASNADAIGRFCAADQDDVRAFLSTALPF